MSITRLLLFSAMSASLCFSSLACGQTTTSSPTTSEVASEVVTEETSQTAVNLDSGVSESGISDATASDSGETTSTPNSVEQTYAGAASPDQTQKNRSAPIQLAQRRFDDGCINLLAYDPEDTYINVRDQPSGNIVRSLPNFALIQAVNGPPIDISEGWNEVLISMTQSSGYIHSDLISHTTYEVLDPDDTSANLRSSPNGEVVTALPNGTVVRFLSREDSWTQVETKAGETGYIASSLLAPPSCY